MLAYHKSDRLEIIRYTDSNFDGILMQNFVTRVQLVTIIDNSLFQ